MLKECRCWGEAKPIDTFVKRSDVPSGIGSYCKPCHANKTKNSLNYKENRKKYWETYKSRRPKYSKTEYMRRRKEKDPLFRFTCQVRSLITKSFKRVKLRKTEKTEGILGISLLAFKEYLELTFSTRYGRCRTSVDLVHIDHKIPLSNASSEEDVIQLCHYSNLQLLLAKDNLKKGSKSEYQPL